MDLVDEELHFLILRYLQEGPCKDAAKALKEEVEKYHLLPKRIDWEGKNYPRAYEQLVSTHPHIAADHIKRICVRLPGLLDEKFPPNVYGVQSLLGAGSQSLLRSEKTAGVTLRPTGYLHCRQTALPPLPNHLTHRPHHLRCLQGREYTGLLRPAEKQPVKLYDNYQLWRRFVGHLSAVYCVLYDRTGNYIFTGADDKLVKIWSAITGRLLATLRGHDGEIVDLAVNYENTLLASGSCDKLVRIWCLKTTACLAVLHGHTATITSLMFCPLVKTDILYLMSTGEDATVCFWHYNKNARQFGPKPIKFIERSRMGVKMLCSSFSPGGLFLATGNSDSVIRIYCLLSGSPDKISELESHNDMVDSIQYSHHSDRFISGSKDGTARIWRHMRCEWLNLILAMKDDSGQGGDNSTALKVNMVAWTAHDDFVLTAVSDFSVRIWCSTTGQPIRSLLGHEEDVFVVECASFNNNLVVTAGHDGRIKLWDIATGRILLDYYNMIDGQGFGAAYDCKWSPHGHSFSATDSHGHLMRFGVGRNEKLGEDKIPSELYFHTDYRGLIRDANGYVLDELTQRAVHLLPPPFLVNVDAAPYPPKYQRLVPGRELLPEEHLKPFLIHLPDGEREVVDREIPTHLLHPPTSQTNSQSLAHSSSISQSQAGISSQSAGTSAQSSTMQSAETKQSAEESAAGSTIDAVNSVPSDLNRETDNQSPSSILSANHSTAHIPSGSSDNSPEVDRNRASQSAPGENKRYLRHVIGDLSDHVIRCMEKFMVETTEHEESQYRVEARKKPFQDGEQTTSAGILPLYLRTRKRRPANYNTRTTQRQEKRLAGEQAVRNRLTTRALYDTDVDSEEEEQQEMSTPPLSADSSSEEVGNVRATRNRVTDGMQSDGGSYGGSSSCSDTANSSSEYSDWEVDTKANLQPPSRKSTRKAVTFESPSSSESTTKTPTKNNVVTPRQRQPSSRAKRARRRGKKLTKQFNSSISEDLPEADRRDPSIIPEWLTSDQPHRSPYFPQIGDEIMYFFQGHQLYIQEVIKEKLYEPKNLPWEKVPHLKAQLLAKITGIKFEIQSTTFTRLCCLQLNAIFPDTGKATGTCFTVKYHDMEGVIDFLVLRQFYATSQQRNWQVGDNFRSIIDKKWYTGTVTAHIPNNSSYPESQFICLEVTWDDESKEQMSPWDLEPLTDDAPDEKLHGAEITEEDRASLQYIPAANEWPEHGQVAECSRISSCLEQLMGYSVSEQFNAPVDLSKVKDYALFIAYPMDLSTIRARLDNGFYRRSSSLWYDIRKIESNAEQFNEQGSKIMRNARIVTDICRGIINDTKCRNTRTIYSSLNLEDDSYIVTDPLASSKSKSKERRKTRAFDWRNAVLEMLEDVNEKNDSQPFTEPLDLTEYADYLEVVDTPMDLGTVEQNLLSGEYETMDEAFKDIRLIFSNSKKYNTAKRSQIYSITMRLSIYVETKMRELTTKQRDSAQSTSSRSVRYSVRHLPDDPLITTISMSRAVAARATRSSDQPSCSYNTSTASNNASSTSHYSTRSSTGRLKPKQFGDYMVGDEISMGSQVRVTRKPRRIVESSDEEPSPPAAAKRANRRARLNTTESDYDKDTDEGEAGKELENESNHSELNGINASDIDTDAADSSDGIYTRTNHTSKRLASKRSRKHVNNNASKKAKLVAHSSPSSKNMSNGYSRSTRHRKGSSAGLYREDSDIDEFANDSGDMIPRSKGSRVKNKSRR